MEDALPLIQLRSTWVPTLYDFERDPIFPTSYDFGSDPILGQSRELKDATVVTTTCITAADFWLVNIQEKALNEGSLQRSLHTCHTVDYNIFLHLVAFS